MTTTTTATGKRWRRRPGSPAGFTHPGLPHLIERLLCARGVESAAGAESFLRADLDRAHDPLLLPNAGAALRRIAAAIQQGERIGVFGDYDVDGVTSTAILVEGIVSLGGDAIPRLPDRFTEGYGLSEVALKELREAGASLVITADCGISATREIEFANEIGLDVIVFDHHAIPEQLPDAFALVDPKLDGCAYPCTELAACGLSFKMLGALAEHIGRAYDPETHMDLVALGTVCDMVPLEGENRWLVRRGLRSLRKTARPGLWALAEAGGFDLRDADAGTLGFKLGPRLNAAGRLASAGTAYELITTRNEARARELARELNRLNTERQRATVAGIALATQLLEQQADAPLIVVGHRDIQQGIVGLVAGRLAEQYRRPALVYQELADGSCRGSARGIPEFDIVEALRAAGPLLERFGGHRQAGGFTVRTENVSALRACLAAYAGEHMAGVDMTPVLDYEEELRLEEFGPQELKWLPFMEPYGQANPEPLFVARALTVAESRPVGADKSHLRLRLRSERAIWTGIAFGLAAAAPQPGAQIDAAFFLRKDRNGRPDLHVQDFAVV
ncbi:MAG: single-stranded-DNA-specific exonuclease RecJ [Dehalococcoidia bacterium]